ncbi:MAG: 4-hydroxy-tetrahydrodipicolinate reductase [Candidatus Omnitrophica bacterium]|nr:4-hydroxy-tetrahydrodipicolinate reductase [Candidatus Omnitrophota bacterium]
MITLCIPGCCGKMGSLIGQLALGDSAYQLVGAVERKGHPAVGRPVSSFLKTDLSVTVTDDFQEAAASADVIIDFTNPAATLGHLTVAQKLGVPMVVGATGFSDDEKKEIGRVASRIPVVYSPNMSLGANLLFQLVRQVSSRLEGYEAEIVELHHRLKKDAPSGTALRLAELIAGERGRSLKDVGVFEREGVVGPRTADEIGVLALRGGDIVGEHTVYFLADGERIELTHKVTSREAFARGALRAARFIVGKKPGLYSMEDVLLSNQ